MTVRMIFSILVSVLVSVPLNAQAASQDQGADLKPNKSIKVTVRGYVRDVACLMKYKAALKPTNDCASMCARAGSPLVVVSKGGTIYTPISASIPDTSQRETLMPFVGDYVEITGEMFQRSGMKALGIEQIRKVDDAKQ
jgi:hypothetical protein